MPSSLPPKNVGALFKNINRRCALRVLGRTKYRLLKTSKSMGGGVNTRRWVLKGFALKCRVAGAPFAQAEATSHRKAVTAVRMISCWTFQHQASTAHVTAVLVGSKALSGCKRAREEDAFNTNCTIALGYGHLL